MLRPGNVDALAFQFLLIIALILLKKQLTARHLYVLIQNALKKVKKLGL